MTPVVKALLIANVGTFTFQLLAASMAQTRLEQIFGLTPYDVTHNFFLWQMVTYMFLHSTFNWFHIGFNMLGLWMFGSALEEHWGSERFARFYFITGIGAGICSVLVSWNSYVPIVGASGAIFGILAAYGILFPNQLIYVYFVLPIKAKWLVLIMGLIAFWSTIYMSHSGIAHAAHLGGMIFGWLYLRNWGAFRGFRFPSPSAWWAKRQQERRRKKFSVYYRTTRGEDEEPDEE